MRTRGLVVLVAAAIAIGAGVEVAGPRDAAPRAEEGFRVWVRNPDGTPVRWDACSPIAWVHNPDGMPRGGLDQLERGVAALVRASGLAFAHEGPVDEMPDRRRSPYLPERYGHRWAPVLVAWAAPGEADVPLLEGDRAIAVPVSVAAGRGTAVFVSGQLVLNREHGRVSQAVVLHELGHLAGLDHVEDRAEAMHPDPQVDGWGPGDQAGLRVVGAAAGCLEAPDPAPVDVAAPLPR